MTGVNAGLTAIIKKARNGVEDVQGRWGPNQPFFASTVLQRDAEPPAPSATA